MEEVKEELLEEDIPSLLGVLLQKDTEQEVTKGPIL
jgi:hypothetical protein